MNNNLIYSSEPSRRASFIAESGKFINLNENKFSLIGYASREPTHSDLHIDKTNMIRLNDGTYLYISEEAYIELPKKEPNKDQYNALLKWFDFLMLNSKKDFIYIGFTTRGNKFRFINKTHSEGLLPEELIKEVRRMYKEKKV